MDNIKDLIFLIRDKQVMIDSDVAKLYSYEVKRINETVKRNKKRFPEDFCFHLTNTEYELLKSQFATSKKEQRYLPGINKSNQGGKQKIPYAFTEKGIIMLAGLLKNDVAISVSLNIVEAFVEMRRFINANEKLFERIITIENTISSKFLEHDKKFDELFKSLQQEREFQQRIFFDGQIYDSYSLLIDIIKKANEKIIIIDNYINDEMLDLLSKKKENVNVLIITSDASNILKLDVKKFNEQYPKITLELDNTFHDRFIIIDDIYIYHIGASLKDLGKKTFVINMIEDKTLLDKIIIHN
jgi:hypothetical protein